MAKELKPNQKAAAALERAMAAAEDGIVLSALLKVKDRALLQKQGYLHRIIRGWHFLTSNVIADRSTVWPYFYWSFLRSYLRERFGPDYCISPETSILLHTDSTAIPTQVSVLVSKGGNGKVDLVAGTSLIYFETELPAERSEDRGLQVFPRTLAVVRAAPQFYKTNAVDMIALLASLADPADLYRTIVRGRNARAGSRLIAFCKSHGLDRLESGVLNAMKVADLQILPKAEVGLGEVGETFTFSSPLRQVSDAAVARLHALWDKFSEQIADVTGKARKSKPLSRDQYLKTAKAISTSDAYHSLSIEGFTVTPEIIERVRAGRWNPDAEDEERKNALSAKGYLAAFTQVLGSIKKAYGKGNQAEIAERDHQQWFQALFSGFSDAGIIEPDRLLGYREGPVIIQGAAHVPPAKEKIPALMETMFERLRKETDPIAAAVLGHFFFVYIHPYRDGNGRMARFLMNLLASRSGHAWTVIRFEHRRKYFDALDRATTRDDLLPFAKFVIEEMALPQPAQPKGAAPKSR